MNSKLKTTLLAAVVGFAAAACGKDDVTPETQVTKLETKTVTDLDASKSNVYYSLANNAVVTGADTATTKWDIKFKGSAIQVNGGVNGTGTTQAQLVSSTFADLATAPASGYKTDAASGVATAGWYTYTGETTPAHAILPVPGKIIVIKTSDGKYAKMEVISYYKGNPNTTTADFADYTKRPAARVYTFKYVYQPNGTTTLQ